MPSLPRLEDLFGSITPAFLRRREEEPVLEEESLTLEEEANGQKLTKLQFAKAVIILMNKHLFDNGIEELNYIEDENEVYKQILSGCISGYNEDGIDNPFDYMEEFDTAHDRYLNKCFGWGCPFKAYRERCGMERCIDDCPDCWDKVLKEFADNHLFMVENIFWYLPIFLPDKRS